jgi:F-type H+-transporting ATPase subunit delta
MKKLNGPLAKRYGTALYECAKEQGATTFQNFIALSEAIDQIFDKEMLVPFSNPVISTQEKFELLDLILNEINKNQNEHPPQFVAFLKLMIEKKRFSQVNVILKNFLEKSDQFFGIVRVSILSATQISEQTVQEFLSTLSLILNKKIILKTKIDPCLQSGFVINIGYLKIDASLRSCLLNLEASLSKE